MSTAKPKTYAALKAERAKMIKKKEEIINAVLVSAKNNPKFVKMLAYSLNSLENFLKPPVYELRLNAKIIIRLEGVGILRSLALKNVQHEDIVTQIADIIWKLISVYDVIDQELALNLTDKGGDEIVIELLLSKNKGPGTVPLVKILNGLCSIPQLINKLLDHGLAETLKLVNDLYSDDMKIMSMNFDTMKKVSNQKNGREFLVSKNLVPSILNNVKTCSDAGNTGAVINGLTVLDNVSRLDEGKKAIKDEEGMKTLSEVLDNFGNDDRILGKGAKIYAKIAVPEDMRKQLDIVKEVKKKIEEDPNQGNIDELREALILVSNLMLVDDIAKVACEDDNFKMLIELFDKICKIDLGDKNEDYIKTYETLMKHFMVVFRRIFNAMPDCYNESTEKGQMCVPLFKNIDDSISKNWDAVKSNVERLEGEQDPKGYIEPIKNAFRSYFTSYADLMVQNYNSKSDNEKKNVNWIRLLEYIVGNVIKNGQKYFDVDEKANFGASKILKIADDVVQNYPDASQTLPKLLFECFPYIKGVINTSENWQTLGNDLDVLYDMVKGDENEEKKKLKDELIPIIVNFMNKKPKFRYPNYDNLKILDVYLTPDFVLQYLSKADPKINPNFALDYVKAIDSVMVRAFYETSTVLKVVGPKIEEDEEEEEFTKEPANEETERKITELGSQLLKRLIDLEEFLRQVKEFKSKAGSFKPGSSKVDEIIALEDNLVYQHAALNIKEYFDAGMADDLATLKDLIKKEIAYIEGFKRIKTNESNPKYDEICEASYKRLRLELGTLRKIEDLAIKNFNESQDPKYRDINKDIIDLNVEVIEKSSDSRNLVEHCQQLRKNISFLSENEAALKSSDPNAPSRTEKYVSSLMKLFGKQINDENIAGAIIKTFIAFATKKPEVCNWLVKAGCPRLLLQVMENTQNKQLARDAIELLKMITLSNQDNLLMVANQNILMKLFEVRAKFASDDVITEGCDRIANEIMKLPGQDKYAAGVIADAIKEFHENMQKYNDFKDPESKPKVLGNVEIINAFTSNKKQIEPLMERQFVDDLNKAIDLTTKDEGVSQDVQKLLTNEMSLLRKIKDNLETKTDERNKDVVDDILKLINNKSNFADSFLLALRTLGDYVKDEELYEKFLKDKIDEKFIDKLLEIQENYLDNPEITKEINNILCYLAMRDPKLASYIVKKGCLANIIEELKSVVFLNDPESKLLKLNGLKMLNSLLNDTANLDVFINSHGVELLNNIVKNEVQISPKNESIPQGAEEAYKTRTTINTKTPEQILAAERSGENVLGEFGRSGTGEEGSSAVRAAAGEGGENEDYFVQCLMLINKGLEKGKDEFVDQNTIKNLTQLAEVNFPDKFLFNEIAGILTKDAVKLDPESVDDNKELLKLALSNKAQYFGDKNVREKADVLGEKLAKIVMNREEYKGDYKPILRDGDAELKEKNKVLTYLALATDAADFKNVLESDKDEMKSFFDDMMLTYKDTLDKLQTDAEGPEPTVAQTSKYYDEGVLIALLKLLHYLLETSTIPKDLPEVLTSLSTIQAMASPYYTPENYLFVSAYNKQIDDILTILGKVLSGDVEDENARNLRFSEANLGNMQNAFGKTVQFLKGYHDEMKRENGGYPEIKEVKEKNLDNILDNDVDYFRTEEDTNFKAPRVKEVNDAVMEIIEDLKKDGVNPRENEGDSDALKEQKKKLRERLQKLWRVINGTIEGDTNSLIVDSSNTQGMKNILDKLYSTINDIGINDANLRDIPKNISSKIENNDEVNGRLVDFVSDDLDKYGSDDKIKYKDIETLANVSKFSGPIKQIMKNDVLWKRLKDEYNKPDLTNEQRQMLATIFRNANKSNYNVESLINNDEEALKLVFNKVLGETIKSLDNGGKRIAETEIESICDILKDTNNYKALADKGIIQEEDLDKLAKIYDPLDSDICKELKPIIDAIKESNKASQEVKIVEEDEQAVEAASKMVNEAYDEHLKELENLNEKNGPYDPGFQYTEGNTEPDILKNASSIQKKKMSIITKTILYNPNNAQVKSPLSVQDNSEMPLTLENILGLIRKNYMALKESQDDELNQRRVAIINDCLLLLKKISLAPINHKPIIEGGLMNFMERICEDNAEVSKNPSLASDMGVNQRLLKFNLNTKNVLADCSHSESTIPSFFDSTSLTGIIDEVLALYEHPEVISINEDMKKIFLCDNIIFSNVCKTKKGFELIFNKIGMEKLIELGHKTGNVTLLEAIINMLVNYVKNYPNKDEIKPEFWESVLDLMRRCYKLKDRSPVLLKNVFDLVSLMYLPHLQIHVDRLKTIEQLNHDFNRLKSNLDGLNSGLIALSVLTHNNAINGNEVVNCGLVEKFKEEIKKITVDSPLDYTEMIYNLTKLYNNLVDNNMEVVEIFSKNGVTENTVYWMDIFNDQVPPMTDEEKAAQFNRTQKALEDQNPLDLGQDTVSSPSSLVDLLRNDPSYSAFFENIEEGMEVQAIQNEDGSISITTKKKEEPKAESGASEIKPLEEAQAAEKEESTNNSSFLSGGEESKREEKVNFVRGIMKNTVNTLDQITISTDANTYLAKKTNFSDCIIKCLKNENNELDFIIPALHSIGSYIQMDVDDNIKSLNLENLYQLLKNLQGKYYSNSDILTNVNYICGGINKNIRENDYVVKFFDLICESTKCQDWNTNLIVMSLKLMHDSLKKHAFLLDAVYDETVPNLFNLLKLYKDNVEIQTNVYKILKLFAKNQEFGFGMIGAGLLNDIKDTINNPAFNHSKRKKTLIRGAVFNLLENLSEEETNSQKISDELMAPLLKELEENGFSEDSDSQFIINLLDSMLKHVHCIQPFVQYKGMELLMTLLDDNDTNVDLILKIFHMYKLIFKGSEEYKQMAQTLKIPDVLNSIIKKAGMYEKKIEYEGRQLIFLVNMVKIKLENTDFDFGDIKIVNPIQPEIKNFLTSGAQVKLINNSGDVKQMHLQFTPDLLKVQAKKIKSNLPPKPKYTIETFNIKQIIKGHGTDAFKLSKGLFRSIPKPELCFSIIGPTTIDGVKAINVNCDTEEEVDKWINSMEVVINYFKKTKTIKNNVVIKK